MFAGNKAAIIPGMMKEVGLDDLQQVYQLRFCDSVWWFPLIGLIYYYDERTHLSDNLKC